MNKNWLLTFSLLLFAFITKGQFEEHLVGYYPFENGRAKDLTKRGGKGKIYGNPKIINGVNGDALLFDGGNHNIVFKKRINNYLRGKRDFTISFYFQTNDLGQRSSLFGKRTDCNNFRMFDLRLSRGKMIAKISKRVQIRNNVHTLIPDNDWHHYTYVRRGNTARIYVDGRLVDKNQIPYIIPIEDYAYFAINASPCKGRDGLGNLRGAIDELKIFNIALTGRDVAYLHEVNSPRSQSYQGLKKDRTRKRKSRIYRQPNSTQRPQNRNNLPNPNRQAGNTPTDARLNSIFGKYEDSNSKSTLVLEPQQFILTIKNPDGYRADELVYVGKYKIEEGDLVLLSGEVFLKKQGNGSDEKIQYQEKIVGDLYENGVDIFAFETRMQLRK